MTQTLPEHAPDALLFIAPGCPHCPGVLSALANLVKDGSIGRLEVVNVAHHPEQAAQLGVRSAPWTRIGALELEGAMSEQELRQWARGADTEQGFSAYLRELLASSRLPVAEKLLVAHPERMTALLPLVEDEQAPMQVQLGVGAILEGMAGQGPLQALVPELARLSTHPSHRVRSDACHYLGLSGSADAKAPLQRCLEDEHPEVREIAAESLEGLGASTVDD